MKDTYEAIAPILHDSFEALIIRNTCPITAATFLNILADLFANLVVSNSKSLVRHTCCVLSTTAGGTIESFLVLVLVMKQENTANRPDLALQKSPLRRCLTLANYLHALKSRTQRHDNPEALHHLSKADLDAFQAVNAALQTTSDENDLAVLRSCSARELRWASDITDCSDTTSRTVSRNHRQFDCALALQGLAVGECYALDATNAEFRTWIHLLFEAGAEHSVGLSQNRV